MLDSSSVNVSALVIKISNPKNDSLCPFTKVSNMKTSYDCGDLENKVKIKLMTCNKRSSIHILGMNVKPVP